MHIFSISLFVPPSVCVLARVVTHFMNYERFCAVIPVDRFYAERTRLV
jgi:hypothetical protein